MRINPYKSSAKYVALTGIMLSAAVVLTMLESQFSAFLPVGVRIGLSNVVIMTALMAINAPTALLLTILKSLFVFITRGFTAGAMSLGGGIAAFIVTFVLVSFSDTSYVLMSVLSAAAHSAAQVIIAALYTQSVYTLYYLPLILAVSIPAGACTGVVLNTVLKRTTILNNDKFIERDGHINEKA